MISYDCDPCALAPVLIIPRVFILLCQQVAPRLLGHKTAPRPLPPRKTEQAPFLYSWIPLVCGHAIQSAIIPPPTFSSSIIHCLVQIIHRPLPRPASHTPVDVLQPSSLVVMLLRFVSLPHHPTSSKWPGSATRPVWRKQAWLWDIHVHASRQI